MIAPGRRAALIAAARAVRKRAHAPYSKFTVGAAVLDERGGLHVGCNVENASYGLTVCAERNAIAAAVAAGARELEEIAVCTESSPPSSPCGGCRQVMFEFATDPGKVKVTAFNPAGERRSWTLAELLPDGFRGSELP